MFAMLVIFLTLAVASFVFGMDRYLDKKFRGQATQPPNSGEIPDPAHTTDLYGTVGQSGGDGLSAPHHPAG